MEVLQLEDVRSRVRLFGEFTAPPPLDPGDAADRRALLAWLNGWGCRIRYPRAGEVDLFDTAVAGWWSRHGHALERVAEPLATLTDAHIDLAADAFGDLSESIVAIGGRRMGPTAAAKALYALRPRSMMPWDLMIAQRLHGGRDAAAYAQHLRLGREWANQLLRASALDEPALVADLGRPGASLAKVLDEYCYVRYTLDR